MNSEQCFLYSTYIHPFNGTLSGTTRVSRYHKGKINLDFTEARDSEWQWHQLGHTQVCTLLQTDNHASAHHSVFYRPDALPAAQPTASKHWRQLNSNCERNQSQDGVTYSQSPAKSSGTGFPHGSSLNPLCVCFCSMTLQWPGSADTAAAVDRLRLLYSTEWSCIQTTRTNHTVMSHCMRQTVALTTTTTTPI